MFTFFDTGLVKNVNFEHGAEIEHSKLEKHEELSDGFGSELLEVEAGDWSIVLMEGEFGGVLFDIDDFVESMPD